MRHSGWEHDKLDTCENIVSISIQELRTALASAEAVIIEYAHKKCKFNQSRTARALGISRGCLRTKLKRYFGGAYL